MKKTPGAMEYPPRSTASSFTILPSVHFQTVPHPLPLPLSDIPPERLQVSWVSGNDLDMTLYVVFFSPVLGVFMEPGGLKA